MLKNKLNKKPLIAALCLCLSQASIAATELDSGSASIGMKLETPFSCALTPTIVDFGAITDRNWTDLTKRQNVEVTCENVPEMTEVSLHIDAEREILSTNEIFYTGVNPVINGKQFFLRIGAKYPTGLSGDKIGSYNSIGYEATKTISFPVDFVAKSFVSSEMFDAVVASGKGNHDLSAILPLSVKTAPR